MARPCKNLVEAAREIRKGLLLSGNRQTQVYFSKEGLLLEVRVAFTPEDRHVVVKTCGRPEMFTLCKTTIDFLEENMKCQEETIVGWTASLKRLDMFAITEEEEDEEATMGPHVTEVAVV